jgi:hypothetical protein
MTAILRKSSALSYMLRARNSQLEARCARQTAQTSIIDYSQNKSMTNDRSGTF